MPRIVHQHNAILSKFAVALVPQDGNLTPKQRLEMKKEAERRRRELELKVGLVCGTGVKGTRSSAIRTVCMIARQCIQRYTYCTGRC